MTEETWRHWTVEWGKVQPRPYQVESAEQILSKGSTLLVMPTALGKTFVAVLVLAGILHKDPKARALFLAPTKPLALQQARRMAELLKLNPEFGGVEVLTGEVASEKREVPWSQAQIIVATPQTCAADLATGKASLSGFSLLVVDECHRAVGDYAYSKIGRRAQLEKGLLVLGLTASPSSEPAKIEEIRFNLGAKNVIIKGEDDTGVAEYVQEVEVDWEYVHLPPLFAQVKERLEAMLADTCAPIISKGLLQKPRNPGQQPSKKMLLEARGQILRLLNSGDRTAYAAMSQQARAMNLVHSIDLLESQGLHSLKEFLDGFGKRTGESKAVKSLWEDPSLQAVRRQVQNALDKGVEHPKFARTSAIVFQAASEGRKVIVFAHYRDSVAKIVTLLNGLNGVKAVALVGRSGGGMSQKQQARAVQDFRDGSYNVLVASSVAEEGLDIPSVDLVVFFEPVPSEIRSIQRRGRAGRVKAGATIVLLAKGTKDEALFWISRRKEELMHSTLRDLADAADVANSKAALEEKPAVKTEGEPDAGHKEGQKTLGDY